MRHQLTTNARQPRLPHSKVMPTGMEPNIRRATKAIAKRMRGAEKEVLALIDQIPYRVERVREPTGNRWIVNKCGHWLYVNRTTYVYEIDQQRLNQVNARIKQILNEWLNTTGDSKPLRWFFDGYNDFAYSQGTARAWDNITNQAASPSIDLTLQAEAAFAMDTEQVLMSTPYRQRIQNVYARSFNNMQGFADGNADKLARVLSNGVAAGDGINEIKRGIRREFDFIQGYRAERIARTEINKSFTDSRIDMTKQTRDELGMNIGVMHISALAPTSRISHMERHGNIYSPEAQQQWWDSGSNHINCLCSITEVLLDEEGNSLTPEFTAQVKKDKQGFLKAA